MSVDKQEAKHITNAGSLVMRGSVNGVLAVAHSLDRSRMKEFVVGAPYTTEMERYGMLQLINNQSTSSVRLTTHSMQVKAFSSLLYQNTTDNVTGVALSRMSFLPAFYTTTDNHYHDKYYHDKYPAAYVSSCHYNLTLFLFLSNSVVQKRDSHARQPRRQYPSYHPDQNSVAH